ncbi:hypothetical protein [Paenibacillus macquariensis]|uniref:Uncharacterized protein n=1 Tax=Paenibacillus macquariensis TaxID=948756 RepID=A0ABY1JKD0_9BACL|nr:hypothetical protein [Paenibacillus macquariensis]MEC0089905.1 hypothetical protein [Paenibacillus macquariensis]OAB31203.1 hypothetical protein PMSM_21015 [Paenibacillus macquariensis subsp. macquariensis]SIQ34004.1 hypothetical protein SAMN05421578_101291 [Paenibacillus macquariensis]
MIDVNVKKGEEVQDWNDNEQKKIVVNNEKIKAKNMPNMGSKIYILKDEETNKKLVSNFEDVMVKIFVNYIKTTNYLERNDK